MHVKLSDGSTASFDLLVGADGVHSWVRQLAFGEEGQFSRFLGCYTAAFIITDPTKSLALPDTLYTLTVPEKQVGIYPIRGGRLATFFVYRRHQLLNNFSFEMAVRELRTAYGGLNWIVPELLERCDRSSMYFDEVSQVEMARWSLGRVTLIGDACHCVSLLAGQGASLAMASAYILADELAKSRSDVAGALAHYERKLRPKIEKKQKAGRRLARWFVPANRVDLAIRDFVMRMAAWPITSHLLRFTFSPESVIYAVVRHATFYPCSSAPLNNWLKSSQERYGSYPTVRRYVAAPWAKRGVPSFPGETSLRRRDASKNPRGLAEMVDSE